MFKELDSELVEFTERLRITPGTYSKTVYLLPEVYDIKRLFKIDLYSGIEHYC